MGNMLINIHFETAFGGIEGKRRLVKTSGLPGLHDAISHLRDPLVLLLLLPSPIVLCFPPIGTVIFFKFFTNISGYAHFPVVR